jgi:hypothetical protein
MSENHYPNEITKLDLLLVLLEKRGNSEMMTSLHPISVRIPIFDYANIEAMAQHSGCSRNKIIIQLIEFALAEVWSGLDEENADEINKLRMSIYENMTREHLAGGASLPQVEPGEA